MPIFYLIAGTGSGLFAALSSLVLGYPMAMAALLYPGVGGLCILLAAYGIRQRPSRHGDWPTA